MGRKKKKKASRLSFFDVRRDFGCIQRIYRLEGVFESRSNNE
jgi:hypothetical protein